MKMEKTCRHSKIKMRMDITCRPAESESEFAQLLSTIDPFTSTLDPFAMSPCGRACGDCGGDLNSRCSLYSNTCWNSAGLS